MHCALMGGKIITSAEYSQRLRSMKPAVYMWERKIDIPADDPRLRPNFDAIATAYDMPLDPKYQDLMTATSPITGKRASMGHKMFPGDKYSASDAATPIFSLET